MFHMRKYQSKDFTAVTRLAQRTYKRYISHEQPVAASVDYLERFNPENQELKKTFLDHRIAFVAEEKQRIIGMIRGRINQVTQLFVLGEYHHRGVGTALMTMFEKDARRQHQKVLRVNATPSAIAFYQKIGYTKTTGIRRGKHRILYQPLKKRLV